MAFDEKLAKRIRQAVAKRKGFTEKQMFGGVAFLFSGNMCVGVHKDALIARVDPEDTTSALKMAHTRVFDLTGRPMKGWILVGPAGTKGAQLASWIARSVRFVETLPAK
ncbi:MAG: TfoX/Sxy family protein [Gemmatimonadaceae bacterium]